MPQYQVVINATVRESFVVYADNADEADKKANSMLEVFDADGVPIICFHETQSVEEIE